jgi:beta-galactosidase
MKKISLTLFITVIFLSVFLNQNILFSNESGKGTSRQVIAFDKGWKFQRGDVVNAEKQDFDDSSWRNIDLPHDWAIEGYVKTTITAEGASELSIVKGEWKFKEGDDMKWKAPDYDDSGWQKVRLPATWQEHSNYIGDNDYGWYRKEIDIPVSMKGKDVIIDLGMIDDVDESYLNGEFIGGVGTLPPKYKSAWNYYREYKINPELIKFGGKNIIAVRVYNGQGNAGIWADKQTELIEGPFNRGSEGGSANGYLSGGIGWYRKTFKLDESMKNLFVSIEFDGVYMGSDVWINNTHLGNHPYGYTSFSYDLTPYLKFGGQNNTISVRVNVKQPCTRWYSGAGIYRHVRLVAVNPVHIAKWGTYITTPEISESEAKINMKTTLENSANSETEVTLRTIIIDKNNSVCATAETTEKISGKNEKEVVQKMKVDKPMLWSPDSPDLYTAISMILVNGEARDAYITTFGIRSVEFTGDGGFFLNKKHVGIKGVCLHHDVGYLGTAVHKRAIERELEIMKAMGCNAIRTSHNPPAPELLEICDRIGMLVLDEAFDEWKESKTEYGYGRFFDDWSEKDLVSMLHRDRNHTCIIMWSIGNEVLEQGASDKDAASAIAEKLVDICHREDGSRLVTAACNGPDSTITGRLDVVGINYNIWAYKKYKGKRKLIASETASAVSTRGEYNLVLEQGEPVMEPQLNSQCSSYDVCKPDWGSHAEDSLKALKNSPWVAGEFVWTGFDYIGEPTPYEWPSCISYFGITDLCGFPKDRYYIYQSQWTDTPMVHILPHWNWKGYEGREIPVWVYSNCDSVELFLNGKSLGEKNMADTGKLHVEWQVPYTPGTITAKAKKQGKEICRQDVRTAGKPENIQLAIDRPEISADGEDLAYITVKVTDSKGVLCPDAENNIKFKVSGSGTLAATGNGNSINHAFFNANECRAFHGMCLAIVRAKETPGAIKITALSKGLKTVKATIKAN